MSPEDISESYHCKNWKFENFGESRTRQGELEGSLRRLLKDAGYYNNVAHMCGYTSHKLFWKTGYITCTWETI
jgi:hypothetical protein